MLCGTADVELTEERIVAMDVDVVTDVILQDCYEIVRASYIELGSDDKAAKSSDFVTSVVGQLEKKISN